MRLWGMPVKVVDDPLTRAYGWYIDQPDAGEAERRVLSGGGVAGCPECERAAARLGVTLLDERNAE